MNRLLQQLEARACRDPGGIVLETACRSMNISELLACVQEVAFRLRAGGYQSVALCADNSPEWVVVDLACQAEGISLTPLPTFFSSRQLLYVLQAAAIDLLIYQDGLDSSFPEQIARSEPEITLARGISGLPLAPATMARIPVGTSKITFTSGSTGDPKGVCLSFDHCLNVAQSLAQATGLEGPRHLCVLPLPVLLENIAGVYAPLLVGGSVVTLPLEDLGFSGSSGVNAEKFLAALCHFQPHTMILVPQLLAVLDAALAMGWKAPESLQFIAVGGARVAASLVQRVRAKGLPVYEGYGLSECASVVSLNSPGCDRPGTSGQVLNHVRVTNDEGQLRVTGNTFLGYLNRPDTWYPEYVDTGDIATVSADGYLTIEGRANNLLISSYGRNISPEWVESELAGTGVFRQAVVFGDGRPYCAALLHPQDEDCADSVVQEAIDEANSRLPDYARVCAWARLPEPMTTAGGLLTANGRPRREYIEQAYGQLIESLYPYLQELKGL